MFGTDLLEDFTPGARASQDSNPSSSSFINLRNLISIKHLKSPSTLVSALMISACLVKLSSEAFFKKIDESFSGNFSSGPRQSVIIIVDSLAILD